MKRSVFTLCVLTFDVFSCLLLLVLLLLNTRAPPSSQSLSTAPDSPELHVPTHGEAQSMRCPPRKVTKMHLDRGASHRGGAEQGGYISASACKHVLV